MIEAIFCNAFGVQNREVILTHYVLHGYLCVLCLVVILNVENNSYII